MTQYTLAEPCCGVKPTFHLLDENMRAHFAACRGGLPEAPLIDWAWSVYGKPGGLFLDIGSHVGSWALPFACAGMLVMAFEPNPLIYPLIEAAVASNHLELQLFLSEIALSDRVGVGRLVAPGVDGGMGSLVVRYGTEATDDVVNTMPLDDLILRPDVIKIDVEGAEVDVLRGAQKTIKEHQPTIFFECWEDERGQRISDLFSYVEELGYKAVKTFWPEMWIAQPV